MKLKRITLNREMLEDARIPQKFWSLGLDKYFGSPLARKLTETYIEHGQRCFQTGMGLYIFGPAQTCKTFLGTFILKCLLQRGFSVRFTTVMDIAREYVGEGATTHSLRQLYGSEQFVFIDDVVGTPQKGEKNGLERVMRIRTTSGLPTVLASILNPDDVISHYGETIANCLGQMKAVPTAHDSGILTLQRNQTNARSEIWKDEPC